MANSKSLIAYFSRRGNNYVGGSIVNLEYGNTEVVAKKLQELTGSDIFQIDTVKPYPDDYTETTKVAMDEKRRNIRPDLTHIVADMSSYEVIYLGYPNWWGTFPMVVFTFLESYDFSGKTILPFCTHEGSGLGRSENDIKNLLPDSKVLTGLEITGGRVTGADYIIKAWLSQYQKVKTS